MQRKQPKNQKKIPLHLKNITQIQRDRIEYLLEEEAELKLSIFSGLCNLFSTASYLGLVDYALLPFVKNIITTGNIHLTFQKYQPLLKIGELRGLSKEELAEYLKTNHPRELIKWKQYFIEDLKKIFGITNTQNKELPALMDLLQFHSFSKLLKMGPTNALLVKPFYEINPVTFENTANLLFYATAGISPFFLPTFLFKRFLKSPLTQHQLPNTFEEADNLIHGLVKSNQRLQAKINTISFFLMFVMVSSSVYLNSYGNLSQESKDIQLFTVMMAVISMVYKSLGEEIIKAYNQYQNNKNHNKKLKLIIGITEIENLFIKQDFHAARTSKNSYFYLYVCKKYLSLSKGETTFIIKNSLFKKGLPVDYNKGAIIIKNDLFVDNSEIDNIITAIETELKQYADAKLFKKQIDQISEKMGAESIAFPEKDDEDKLRYRCYVKVSPQYQSFVSEQTIGNLFPLGTEVTEIENILIIQGNQPIDEISLKKFIDSLPNQTLNISHFDNYSDSRKEEKEEKYPRSKKTKLEENKRTLPDKKSEEIATKVTWTNHEYDPVKPRNKIKVLVPANNNSLPRNTFFTSFDLSVTDFSNKEEYDKFLANSDKVCSRKWNKQGVKFINQEVETEQGKFHAHAEIKLLGFFGNPRVYATAERNAEGKVLFSFKGYVSNTHKRW